jgi:hypothetical protein
MSQETPRQRVDRLRAELCDPKVTLDMIVSEFDAACADRERADVAEELARAERAQQRRVAKNRGRRRAP